MDIERGPLVPEREDGSGEATFSLIEDGVEKLYGVRVELPPFPKPDVAVEATPADTNDAEPVE